MKNFFVFAACALALLGGSGCANDIDTNADWKEILVVYGLLNPENTDHYIRVNRAFLSENQSALEIAKNVDSLYFDSLEVTIEEYDLGGNTLNRAYRLTKTSTAKDSGIFATEGNYVYTFSTGPDSSQRIDVNHLYKLIIYNKVSKKYTTAQTKLVDKPSLLTPSNSTSNFNVDTAKSIILSWNGGLNAKIYDVYMRFYWDEYDSASKQLLASDMYIDWPMAQNREVIATGPIRSNIPGDNFYTYVADHVPGVIGKYRIPKKIDFIYWAADNEFYLYRSVNQASVGIVQKKPEYTNITGGSLGLFASRNSYTVENITISEKTKTFLQIYSKTRHLKFQ
jgi:hypothetical protein